MFQILILSGNSMNIYAKMRQLRESQGLTQEYVGKQVSLSRSSIANIEAGRQSISFEMAVLLFKVYGYRLTVSVATP